MNKVYVVRSKTGEGFDSTESLLKAFESVKDAEKYADKHEKEELYLRAAAERCKRCDGKNKDCPMFVASMYKDSDCDNYEPYHNNSWYWVDDVEFEERKRGKTV